MIKVVAKLTVKEEKIEEFKEIAKKLVEETHKEEGCISYNLYEDIKNPCILTFIEEWESTEALAIHEKTPHFTENFPKMASLKSEPSVINVYKKII